MVKLLLKVIGCNFILPNLVAIAIKWSLKGVAKKCVCVFSIVRAHQYKQLNSNIFVDLTNVHTHIHSKTYAHIYTHTQLPE